MIFLIIFQGEPLISPQLVEQLLNEFHFGNTNNARKREIETQLVQFQNHPTSWTYCVYQLSNNITNQYVWFFNISTIEVMCCNMKIHFKRIIFI